MSLDIIDNSYISVLNRQSSVYYVDSQLLTTQIVRLEFVIKFQIAHCDCGVAVRAKITWRSTTTPTLQ